MMDVLNKTSNTGKRTYTNEIISNQAASAQQRKQSGENSNYKTEGIMQIIHETKD